MPTDAWNQAAMAMRPLQKTRVGRAVGVDVRLQKSAMTTAGERRDEASLL
jgi:hypothetical protein